MLAYYHMQYREYEAPQISQGSGPLDNSASREETSPGPPVVVTEGRRRGRRKVLKKKTMKDEEGYLGMYYGLYQVE